MKIEVDLVASAVYVYVLSGESVAETREVTDLINLDLNAAGQVIGVEILCPDGVPDVTTRVWSGAPDLP